VQDATLRTLTGAAARAREDAGEEKKVDG
jgi:hypothetical protein